MNLSQAQARAYALMQARADELKRQREREEAAARKRNDQRDLIVGLACIVGMLALAVMQAACMLPGGCH